MYSSWNIVCNRQTDKQKKWHIEVGAPSKIMTRKNTFLLNANLYILFFFSLQKIIGLFSYKHFKHKYKAKIAQHLDSMICITFPSKP